MEWRGIATYPKSSVGSGPMVVLARFYQIELEDGDLSQPVLGWYAVGCWFNGWAARSGAQFGVFPGNDWISLKEPTHWCPLPPDPAGSADFNVEDDSL